MKRYVLTCTQSRLGGSDATMRLCAFCRWCRLSSHDKVQPGKQEINGRRVICAEVRLTGILLFFCCNNLRIVGVGSEVCEELGCTEHGMAGALSGAMGSILGGVSGGVVKKYCTEYGSKL